MNKRILSAIFGLSLAIFLGLLWFIYFKESVPTTSRFITYIPGLNASLNAMSALFILFGILAIKRGIRTAHIVCMASALTFSAAFLVCYLIYHHFHGDTVFLGTGLVRPLYFFILISHIVLTFFMLPMLLTTVYAALTKDFELHKKIARWTYPIWLYVSITGVLIYLMLKLFN